MPTYKVKSPGFMFGNLYEPDGKRPILTTDKPLKPLPAWLEVTSAAKARKKPVKKSTGGLDKDQTKVEVDAVTFVDDVPPEGSKTTETL